MTQKVLILGGTGFVGRHVCEKLVRESCSVTLPTRHLTHGSETGMLPLVYPVETNIHDENVLQALVAQADVVINLVAILQGTQQAFEHAHVQLMDKLVRACSATGVQRVVHVSALGADARNPDGLPSRYLRSKSRGEQILRASELDWTILRPSVIFGAEDKFLNVFADMQQVLPVIPLAGAHATFQPVWVEDVATAVVHCAMTEHRHATARQTYEACGPDVFTLKQLVQLAGQYSGANGGRGRPVLPLPDALARVQAWVMEQLPGVPLLSRDNLDSMQVPNVATGHFPGLDALGITPAALAAIAPTYLGHQGPRSNLTEKRRLAGRG